MTKLGIGVLLLAWLDVSQTAFAVESDAANEERIRKVVEQMLHAKDKKISALEARLNELEQLAKSQQNVINQLQAADKAKPQVTAQAPLSGIEPGKTAVATVSETGKSTNSGTLAKFLPMKKKEPVKGEEEDRGPKVGGFMDVTGQTKSNGNQPFNVGIVELDLDRIVSSEHFAASAALDWFPYGVSPATQVGVAFVDFHLYDASVPVRGRIFQEPGFHLQAGMFDLPFSSDYQFFASKDRLTVTPPLTTTRIQQSGVNPANGGFNAAGIRTYGNWSQLSYAAYYTNSVYSNGSAVGGRLGLFMNNPYRIHKRRDLPILDFGVSGLLDMDKSEHWTDQVYAVDLSINYESFRLISEFMMHESNRNRTDGEPALNENAFHVTLIGNLENWIKHPLYAYGRYDEWLPRYRYLEDNGALEGGGQYFVKKIPRLTVGLGYRLNDYLQIKPEYADTFGNRTQEPGFQTKMGIAQLVATF